MQIIFDTGDILKDGQGQCNKLGEYDRSLRFFFVRGFLKITEYITDWLGVSVESSADPKG